MSLELEASRHERRPFHHKPTPPSDFGRVAWSTTPTIIRSGHGTRISQTRAAYTQAKCAGAHRIELCGMWRASGSSFPLALLCKQLKIKSCCARSSWPACHMLDNHDAAFASRRALRACLGAPTIRCHARTLAWEPCRLHQ